MGIDNVLSFHSQLFLDITKLGIYNPRLNMVYTYEISKIPREVIVDIERDVVGYVDARTVGCAGDKEIVSDVSEVWKLDDLITRYGVSWSKITGDFVKYGLPYYMVGHSYRFDPEEVMAWEIDQRSIPYGKNDEIVLPAYTEYRVILKSELRNAKKNKDKEKIRTIKKEWKRCGYSNRFLRKSCTIYVYNEFKGLCI